MARESTFCTKMVASNLCRSCHWTRFRITRCETICAIADPAVLDLAQQHGCTRAAAAMAHLADRIHNGIVAIGNAPTAIWSVLELHERQGITPAVVIGLPVGFVGAAESKQALWESGLPCITNIGPRGGSPWAAAAVNHLARCAQGGHPCPSKSVSSASLP